MPSISPESIAFVELISYIETFQQIDDTCTSHIFKLADIVTLYKERLRQLGADTTCINPTRLKEKLVDQIPGLEANKSNYEVVLSFKKDIGDALLYASKADMDSDAVTLMRAACIVRKDILRTSYKFNGTLTDEQYANNPVTLSTLVQMIIGGTNIRNQSDSHEDLSTAARSLTQLLVFNTVKQRHTKCETVRHAVERETLMPLYLGLLIHNKTRKRELIDVLFQKGLSVSYSRVLQVSTGLANDAIDSFEADGVIVPTTLRTNVYTTGNLDNIDHNPSATSAKGAFHGTAISLTQHVSQANAGNIREISHIARSENEKQRQLKQLPETYTSVPPVAIPCNNPVPPVTSETAQPDSSLSDADNTQTEWLTRVKELLQKDEFDATEAISWSAFFASMKVTDVRPSAITAFYLCFAIMHTH